MSSGEATPSQPPATLPTEEPVVSQLIPFPPLASQQIAATILQTPSILVDQRRRETAVANRQRLQFSTPATAAGVSSTVTQQTHIPTPNATPQFTTTNGQQTMLTPSMAQQVLLNMGYFVGPETFSPQQQFQWPQIYYPQQVPLQHYTPPLVQHTPLSHSQTPAYTSQNEQSQQNNPAAMLAQILNQAMQPAPPPPVPPPENPMVANLRAALMGLPAPRQIQAPDVAMHFMEHISVTPLPYNTSVPLGVGNYDGTTDPEDFLCGFDNAIRTQHWSDAVACHMFQSVLHDLARRWLHEQPPRSITGWADLREKFIRRLHQRRT